MSWDTDFLFITAWKGSGLFLFTASHYRFHLALTTLAHVLLHWNGYNYTIIPDFRMKIFHFILSETKQPDEAWSFTQLSRSNLSPDTCSQALNQNCTWGLKSRPRRNQVMQPCPLFNKLRKLKKQTKSQQWQYLNLEFLWRYSCLRFPNTDIYLTQNPTWSPCVLSGM